jgi:hypothetical protein
MAGSFRFIVACHAVVQQANLDKATQGNGKYNQRNQRQIVEIHATSPDK